LGRGAGGISLFISQFPPFFPFFIIFICHSLLPQRLTATRLGATDALIVGDTTMVETLALGGGSDGQSAGAGGLAAGGLPGGRSLPGAAAGLGAAVGSALLPGGLVVTVDGSWELKRRVNLMAVDQAEAAVVCVTAQSLRYDEKLGSSYTRALLKGRSQRAHKHTLPPPFFICVFSALIFF
jgi:hypothetical protein